jgi:hypothetical protein
MGTDKSIYNFVKPPFRLKFREMPRNELRAYAKWFHEVTPLRIEELTKAVNLSEGYQSWRPEYNPKSLSALGDWFAARVQTRQRTQEELQKVVSLSRHPIPVPDQELTDQTISLAMDIGMYLGKVFLTNHSSLKWDQPFGSKNFIDYGQPVLVEFTYAPFNPVRMVIGQAYGIASRAHSGKGLREVYDIWAKAVKE